MNTCAGGRAKLAWAATLVALFAMVAGCGGCLVVAVPSLAYEGYKYESGDQQQNQVRQRQSTTQPPADDSVE